MVVEKDGLYDVMFTFQNHETGQTRSDALVMRGVALQAGEIVEDYCKEWLGEDVKDPRDWSISSVTLQKKGGK